MEVYILNVSPAILILFRFAMFFASKIQLDFTFTDWIFTIWLVIKILYITAQSLHKTVTLKLTLTLTLTDTAGAVLTLMLGYRRLRIYKLKRKIQN